MLFVPLTVVNRLLESLIQVGLDFEGGLRVRALTHHDRVDQDHLEQELVLWCGLTLKLQLRHLKDSVRCAFAGWVVQLRCVKSVKRHHQEEILISVDFFHHFDVFGSDVNDLRRVLLLLRLSFKHLNQKIVQLGCKRVLRRVDLSGCLDSVFYDFKSLVHVLLQNVHTN